MWMMKKFLVLSAFTLLLISCSSSQPLNQKKKFNRQDSLRGSIGPERAWWDVTRYDISVTPDYKSKSIQGKVVISFRWLQPKAINSAMQIDLQEPMKIDSVVYRNKKLSYRREKNVFFINWPDLAHPAEDSVFIYYNGIPLEANNPPWDGGWIWKQDEKGRPWISVACQGLGASVWFPCKDHQSDEPEKGASLTITVPDSLMAVGNGKLKTTSKSGGNTSYTWEVVNPINNYNIIPYIGNYVNFSEVYKGEKGNLNCDYWVLDYNLEKAKKQFVQGPMTLKAFEYWFSSFPWYEDHFKLVEAPHLGMEHQSAVAYGNGYQNGYLGSDRSGTGLGLKWDFIIVHEVGHEWFGNNITSKDIADMWVHESFTCYSETLFTEYYYGKDAAEKYIVGLRRNIKNDKPIIGIYGLNQEGSGDMYDKGANMLHTIRQVISDDKLFREILRGLNRDFYHQTVTSKQVEDYISGKAGKDLSKIFDQYLRTTMIPVLELKKDKDKLEFRWTNCIPGFNMPVRLTNGKWINPTTSKQVLKAEGMNFANVSADKAFYIELHSAD
jgi:aminopeptidase N